MKYLAALLLVVSVAVGYAQIPPRCTSPETWEARFFAYEEGSPYSGHGRFYSDAPGQRYAVFEEIFEGDEETAAYNEYFFHKEKYMLRYNTLTKQCIRSFLNETFIPIRVSPTARFIGTHVIGTNAIEQFGLTVNIWSDNLGADGQVIAEFVADDGDGDENCLPVSYTEFGGGPGRSGYRHSAFYDIVIGVNPIHFIPPEECS